MMNVPVKSGASEQHPSRACTSCRSAKVRCLPNPHPSSPSSSKICLRCSRTSRTCIFTSPQKRKARKRTDTRVAELEREVQAMRALFHEKLDAEGRERLNNALKDDIFEERTSEEEEAEINVEKAIEGTAMVDGKASEGGVSAPYHHNPAPAPATPAPTILRRTPAISPPDLDVIDRGVVSKQDAYQLFYAYMNVLLPHYPAVQFPPSTNPAFIRQTKPTLFLACIAAASGKHDPHLYSVLNSELLTSYAYRTVINSEKNLELVQAMIVTSVWYHPPGRFAQLKVYEYINMASSMAVDIGLSNNPSIQFERNRRVLDTPIDQTKMGPLDEEELQKRRTILVCFMSTTAASVGMRRLNQLRFNKWMSDCVDIIANNPGASKLDGHLAAWTRLFKITDDIGTSFSFDDPTNMPNLAEPRVQIMITGYEKTLEAWRAAHENYLDDGMMLQYYHTQLYLHEVGLHDDHPPGKFMPPWTLQKVLSIDIDPQSTSFHINTIAVTISSAHSLLDIMLKMEIDSLRSLPMINFVRIAYTFISLISVYISAKSSESKIGAVVDIESIRLGFYFNSVIEKLIQAVGPKEFRAPSTFLGMIMRWQDWYESQEDEQYFIPPTEFNPVDIFWVPPIVYERARESGKESGNTSSDGTSNLSPSNPDSKNTPSQDNVENFEMNENTQMEMNYDLSAEFPYNETGQPVDIVPTDAFDPFDSTFTDWMPVADASVAQLPLGYSWDMQNTNHSST